MVGDGANSETDNTYGVHRRIHLRLIYYKFYVTGGRHNLGQVENDLAKLETERNQLQATHKALTAQNHQQSEEVQQVRRRLMDIEGRYEMAQHANKKSERKIRNLEDHVMQLEKGAAVAQEKIQSLFASNDNAEGRLEALRDENTLLKQEKAGIEGQFKQLQRSL